MSLRILKPPAFRPLDETANKGKEFLSKFSWGCNDGDHTGYAFLDGKNKQEIKSKLPKVSRDKSKIVQVGKLTEAQIRAYHTA